MKVYTKTGDTGDTGLLGGHRVSKHDVCIEAYGTVDELNAYIGLLRDQTVNAAHAQLLLSIQEKLFVIGAHLSDGGNKRIALPMLKDSDVRALEQAIDAIADKLGPMRHFILPGGHVSVSTGHVARCVCRRAERRVVEMKAQGREVASLIVSYLNRLSDYLFMLCRAMSNALGVAETPWVPKKAPA